MRRHLTLLSLITAGLVVAQSAPAFVLLAPRRTWDNPPNYIVDNRGVPSISDGDGGATRTVNAVESSAAWNGAGSGNLVNAQKGSVLGFQLGDNVPMLNFRDPVGGCTGNCLAATFVGFYTQRSDTTHRINDADIVTNTAFSWTSQGEDPGGSGCSNEFYIEGVMVHETGHGLGLGHTNVSGATMFPSVSACNNGPATTESDDEAGINNLYGRGVLYRAHVQELGWLDWVRDGQTAGTVGQHKRMEAARIKLNRPEAGRGICYRSHVEGIGWQGTVCNGAITGTVGQHKRMEAIQISLTGHPSGCNVEYRAYVQSLGWLPWVKNGATAGTTGQHLRMEAMQVKRTGSCG